METHFLSDFIAGQTRQSPEPWYNSDGDCIIYQMCDEAVVAERVDEVLTIYNSAISGKAIGYQIKGVAALARAFGWEGILVEFQHDNGELKEPPRISLTIRLWRIFIASEGQDSGQTIFSKPSLR